MGEVEFEAVVDVELELLGTGGGGIEISTGEALFSLTAPPGTLGVKVWLLFLVPLLGFGVLVPEVDPAELDPDPDPEKDMMVDFEPRC